MHDFAQVLIIAVFGIALTEIIADPRSNFDAL